MISNEVNQPDSEEALHSYFIREFVEGLSPIDARVRDLTYRTLKEIVKVYQGGKIYQHGQVLAPNLKRYSGPASWEEHLRKIGLLTNNGKKRLKGKKILDIGCGAPLSKEDIQKLDSGIKPDHYDKSRFLSRDVHWATYEPWLCRILDLMGADVTGVDIRSNDGERFSHVKLDLSVPGALDVFESQSFDIVHSDMLDNSPSFNEDLARMRVSREEIIDEIFYVQAKRIVKPKGEVFRGTHKVV